MTPLVLAIRFGCEVALLVAVVWWGVSLGGAGIALGIVLGLAVGAVWGELIGPRAKRRLRDPARLVLELLLFAGGTAAYAAVGHDGVALVFAACAGATAFLTRRLAPGGWPS